jgi:hypothetical protein
MAGILKVDRIQEANSGQGVELSHKLVDTSGNTIISENSNGVATLGASVAPSTNYTFRNKIINGNLKSARVINQRGATSIAPSGSTGYTYDRWYYDDGSNYLYQGIEDLNVNNGTYVISWEGDDLIAHWALEDDNDTTPPYTAGPDSALTWNQVSKNSTFTINENPEHGKHLWIRFSLDTGGDFANLDKVQVEEGTVPTPFEHRPIGTELALCQRYYQKSFALTQTPAQNDSNNHFNFSLAADGASNGTTSYIFPVEMRAAPTIITFNPYAANNNFRKPNSLTDYSVSVSSRSKHFVFYSTSSGTVALSGHFTAVAEL